MTTSDDDQQSPALSTLQEAALQLLGAAKLFIAAAEQVVADPKSLGRIGEVVNGAVTDLARAANRIVAPRPPPEDDDDGVQHIDLSD
ncbi:MAG: hypothetical protein QOD72_50 [Acidimicrobiaceae bacterium]|nr:hypothetical protein [Acidimicrobiaceae bacterium]